MRRRLVALAAAAGLLLSGAAAAPVSASQGGRHLDDLRAATARYFDVGNAQDAGYGELRDAAGIACIDSPAGAMGIHYVNGSLVGDGDISLLTPEAMIYEPHGTDLDLVAVEYVVLADAWHQAHGKQPPKLLGQKFTLVRAGNRYGLPDFYELHVWLWKTNPAGLFEDFNPDASCDGS